MRSIDVILSELTRIRDRLEAAIDEDERARLSEQREALRREAREASPATRAELERQLERLIAAWDRLQKQRIDVVKQAGGGSTGGDFGFAADAVSLNQKIDQAGGRTEIEDRIRALKARLAEFEDDLR